MRNRRDIADQGKIEADRLQRTHRRLAPGTGTFNKDLDFFEPVAHRLSRCVLCDQLRRIRRALARTFKTNFPGARPADHISIQIRNRDDGVVKGRINMRDAGMNVLGPFCLNNLGLLDVVGI